jgi:hypothetical protein
METMEGKCPIKGCQFPAFVKKTKSGKEYSYMCLSGNHRGFVSIRDAALLQIQTEEDREKYFDSL